MFLALFAALGAASCSGQDENESTAVSRDELCTKATLAASSLGPVPTGTSLALTATSPSCAAGQTPEYRFFVRRDGATTAYTEIRGYSTLASATFNTAGLPSGKYTLLVYSRAVGSSGSRESSASLTVYVGSACTATTLTTTPAPPQRAGTVVSLSANTTCSSGTPEYRFLVAPPGSSTYAEVSGWGPLPASWSTPGLAAGPYALRIYARAVGNTSAYESISSLSYRIGEACTAVAGTFSPAVSAAPGADVAVVGNATCTNGAAADYQFSYRPSGSTAWQLIRSWGPADVSWHSLGLASGPYQVLIEARANDYAGPKQTSKTLTYTLGGRCTSAALTVAPKAPQPVGSILALAGSATCTGSVADFRYLYREPLASAYTEIAPWGAPATINWSTLGRTPGSYSLLVEARSQNVGGVRQAYKAVSFVVGDVCNKVTLTAAPPSPEPAGTSVTLTAKATCVFGGTPEYRFSQRFAGGAWVTFRDWDASALASTAAANLIEGNYELRVETRGQGHPGPYEALKSIPFSFAGACAPGYAPNGAGGCVDVNECATGNGGCDPLTTCTNAEGSFSCGSCPTGFSGSGSGGCDDVDECADDNGGCDALTACTNEAGSFNCGACPPGYTGTGATGCVAVPPPACTPNPCQNGGTCAVNGSGFTCTCAGGYGGSLCQIAPVKLLAAGDVADCGVTTDTATGLLLDSRPGPIALIGDAAYPNGATTDFTNCFEPVWGRHKSRIFPVPGNHEYLSTNAAPHFAYFGAAAGDPSKGYYSYDLGSWHIVALNSNCSSVACAAGSVQEQWLRQDLAAHPAACTLAYWHHPRFSSGEHGNASNMSAIWQALVDGGVELALSAHDHDYERFQAQNDSAAALATGVVQFVVGTGGVALRSFGTVRPNSLVRESATHGVLEFTLNAGSYAWNFIPVAGKTFSDSGLAACH